ncbi:MAG TPA: FAD-dependent monooxygenase [Gemmatimonadaceae bacterium]
MSEVQTVILGAGPAGSAAARLLAGWGIDVVVLARRTSSDRALGESLPPSAVALLERIGFSGLGATGALRATGNTVRWGNDAERVERFAGGLDGYQVDRASFDAFLAREATGSGADVRLGANVLRVARDGAATVTYELDGETTTLRADWILDCSGRTGVIARDGWRVADDAARTTAIVGVWERDGPWPTPDPTHTIVESTEDGWAWSVPVSDTRRYVTLMLDPRLTSVATRGDLTASYTRLLGRTRTLSALVHGARLDGTVFARDASPYHARLYADQGAMLVGDAASFVDPLSSYGIKKALASGWLASVCVHSILTNSAVESAALELFNSRERAMHDALRRAATTLARDAAGSHPTAFWETRSASSSSDAQGAFEPDILELRTDPDVLRALDELRSRDAIHLQPTTSAQRVGRPTVRGNRVVVEDHLVVPAFPEGVRYVRNIDLLKLSKLASSNTQVPDLFDAYNRVASPAPLPDFLGALSLLVGKGFLEWSSPGDPRR